MKLRALLLLPALFLLMPVAASAAAPRCTLQATPSSIIKGQSFTLRWNSFDATSGAITGVPGTIPLNGSINLIPVRSTRFVGTFTGPGGKAVCEATISVEIEGIFGSVFNAEGESGMTVLSPGILVESPASDIKLSNDPGTGIVPCTGINCQACDLAKLGQNSINFLIGLSIPLAAALFAYAGFLYFTSSVQDKLAKAKKIFSSVAIGFAIVVAGYLVVETILHTILKETYWKSWNQIECVKQADNTQGGRQLNKNVSDLLSVLPFLNTAPQSQVISVQTQSSSYGCQSGWEYVSDYAQCISPDRTQVVDATLSGSQMSFNQYNNNIQGAIDGYIDSDTSMGPGAGRVACAWAVNNVLTGAGVSALDGNAVEGMENALRDGGRGELIDPADAQKGNIVVWKEGTVSHVGFCNTDGCTKTISNGSNSARFNNDQGLVFQGVTGRIYRLK